MKKKTIIALVIILIFAAIGAAAGYLIKKNKKSAPECETGESTVCKVDLKDTVTVTSTKTTVGSFGDKTKVSSNTYRNEQFGFEITFTDAWKNSKVKETIPAQGSEGTIEFQFATSDKSFNDGLATALKLIVYKKDNYKTDDPLVMKVGENTSYVVAYKAWEQAPSDVQTITEKEIANTAATLKFFK